MFILFLEHGAMSLIRSKQRIADHGEVFTPPWMVDAMLDLVKGECERIESRFLEPACGSGNFLTRILQRKLAAVRVKFARSAFETRHFALLALMSCYGIELLEDNIAECRANMFGVLSGFLALDPEDELAAAALHVLSLNIIHGDALTMQTSEGKPITFSEWGYLGKGKFQRRDFRLDRMTEAAGLVEDASLFGQLGKHEVFRPARILPPQTIAALAEARQHRMAAHGG
jgi:hypothetical protein